MILTHPFLFNAIVVLFIAFTSGWIVFVFSSRGMSRLRNKISSLENEKEQVRRQMTELEDQLLNRFTHTKGNSSLMSLSSAAKIKKIS